MTFRLTLALMALVAGLAGCAGLPSPTATAVPDDSVAPGAADTGSTFALRTERGPSGTLRPSGPLLPITAAQASSMAVMTLETPPDLWDRIRRGLAMPDIDSDLVRQHEQWYASRPDYIQRMTERSRKYLFHIVEELERRNMPAELALLPFIESAFNPQAVSSARAAGMWQFMPATGTQFELRQNVFRDDRRDVLASTRAALDYLQQLHGMFNDWHLALAAYNWGQGNVARAIARNQKAGLGTGYADLNMPAETRNYVPKLQAVKNIVMRPGQFATELPLIENHPYFQSVTINRDIDVELVARLADVRLEDFKALNPSFKQPVILAASNPQILLPWDNAKLFERNLEGYATGRYASWTAWTAPSTMTVADAARRVGMSESEFRSLNSIPPRMLIRGGSVVLAPRGTRQDEDVASHVAQNGQLSLAPEVVMRRITVKAGKADTVSSLAARHKVRPADVAHWNNLAENARLRPGQALVLEVAAKAKAAAPAGAQVAAKAGGVAGKGKKPAAGKTVSAKSAAKAGSTKTQVASKNGR